MRRRASPTVTTPPVQRNYVPGGWRTTPIRARPSRSSCRSRGTTKLLHPQRQGGLWARRRDERPAGRCRAPRNRSRGVRVMGSTARPATRRSMEQDRWLSGADGSLPRRADRGERRPGDQGQGLGSWGRTTRTVKLYMPDGFTPSRATIDEAGAENSARRAFFSRSRAFPSTSSGPRARSSSRSSPKREARRPACRPVRRLRRAGGADRPRCDREL